MHPSGSRSCPSTGTARLRRDDGAEVGAYAGLGTFAEVLVVPEGQLVPVETDLPYEQLALIGCGVSTGVGAVLNTARVEPGSSVAVFGGGAAATTPSRRPAARRLPKRLRRDPPRRHHRDRWRPASGGRAALVGPRASPEREGGDRLSRRFVRPLRDFRRYVELAETGRLDLAALVSRTLPLASVNEAFAMARGDVIRSVVVTA